MVWSFRFEHVHGVHETTVTVLVGLVLGFVTYYIDGKAPVFSYRSYFVLPMVIFDAGFNLEKKRFFWYVAPIAALGLVGTVIIFMLIFVCSGLNDVFPGVFKTFQGGDIQLSVQERLVMASVLSSTDSVAPIAFLPKDMYPRLFAIVFGEGVLNDVVAILLSTSVTNSDALPSIVDITVTIAYYLVTSSFMGVSFGFSVSYVFKHSQWLHEEVVHPCALMLLLNYICYVLTEMCEFSSIFALFVCSLLCGHYAQTSLSEEAQEFADQISEFLAYCAEAFVFGYFGMTAVGYLMEPSQFSPTLILFYSLLIVLSRALTVLTISVLLRVVRIHHLSLRWNHMAVIMMAGCMRGAIAYALILKAVPPAGQQSPQQVVMVSTVLGIVLLNCLVFGGLFPVVMRRLGIQALGASLPHGISHSFLESSAEASHHYRMRAKLHAAWSHFDNSRLKPLLQKDWGHPEPPRRKLLDADGEEPDATPVRRDALETRCRTCSI
ncbi:unnamed protein product [Prorocentrum cordatum]|uniref:Cation/H+ exchanger transmembrane domain-containing protein n=1 Tax=Prorocentrum cordatum TaxID=2364126 RepID=A0ABN9WSH5_9DINO|nr:unnamed protein product [Polarella glacialis]